MKRIYFVQFRSVNQGFGHLWAAQKAGKLMFNILAWVQFMRQINVDFLFIKALLKLSFRKIARSSSLKPIFVRRRKKFVEMVILLMIRCLCNPYIESTTSYAIARLQLVVHHSKNSKLSFYNQHIACGDKTSEFGNRFLSACQVSG